MAPIRETNPVGLFTRVKSNSSTPQGERMSVAFPKGSKPRCVTPQADS